MPTETPMSTTAPTTTAILHSSLHGTRWVVDVDHTTVEFRVRDAGIAKVRGVFREFDGELVFDADPTAHARGTVDAASLDTRIAARDDHLRSPDFFDVENHPQLTFASTAIEHDGGRLQIRGDLAIRGVVKPIELEGEIVGTARDDDGNERIGLELRGSLDRRDYGLTWNTAIDGGGVLVGNRVDLVLEVSAIRAD